MTLEDELADFSWAVATYFNFSSFGGLLLQGHCDKLEHLIIEDHFNL